MSWNDLIGRQIGPYEIIEELGRGGSSRVYRAYQESMHRYVAVKVLSNDSEDRQGFVRRFDREVEAVAQLSHPNIVAVYDSGELEDLVYLVMQCVTGGTLRQRLGRPLLVADACAAMVQMARALHHAHLHGIIHRDVKPSNMLIDTGENGRLLLTDFGIAKLHGMRGLTKSGTTVGTPEYMAPEQAEGREIDARVDVYSLGCVLYEALAGRPPFIGATPVSVLYQQVHSRPSYIRGFNPQVPRELARVLDLALAKRPEERFASAESLAHALHPFAGGREHASFSFPGSGTLAHPETPPAGLDLRTPPRGAPLRLPDTGLGTKYLGGTGPLPEAELVPPSPTPPTPAPASGPLRGLGAEGLDALFPNDPEAQEARKLREAQESGATADPALVPGLVSGSALLPEAFDPPTRPYSGPRPTIPLMAFRLPARDAGTSGPLALPLTAEGQVDMEALMAEVDQRTVGPTVLPPPAIREFGDSVDLPGYDAQQLDRTNVLEEAPGWGEERDTREASVEQAERSPSGSWIAQGTPPPVWRPETIELPADRQRSLRFTVPAELPRLSRLSVGLAAVALLALALGTYAAVRAAGAGIAHRTPTPTPSLVPTLTPTALPTATSQPQPTATLTPQQVLNQEAAAAFRSITLEQSFDGACSTARNTSTFTTGQYVYINLCAASTAPAGTMTVLLRQGGTTVTVMARDVLIYPGHWYDRYSPPYALAPGTYDILVIFNGGTAADLSFTVTRG